MHNELSKNKHKTTEDEESSTLNETNERTGAVCFSSGRASVMSAIACQAVQKSKKRKERFLKILQSELHHGELWLSHDATVGSHFTHF